MYGERLQRNIEQFVLTNKDASEDIALNVFFKPLIEAGVPRRQISSLLSHIIAAGTQKNGKMMTVGHARAAVQSLIQTLGEPPENLKPQSRWRDRFRSHTKAYELFYAILPVFRNTR